MGSSGLGRNGASLDSYINQFRSNSSGSFSPSTLSSFDPGSSPLPYSQGNMIPLLSKSQASDSNIDNAFQSACDASAQEAIKPFVEKQLQKPGTRNSREKNNPAQPSSLPPVDPMIETMDSGPSIGATTDKGALFTAQQISKARNLVRQRLYLQAIIATRPPGRSIRIISIPWSESSFAMS
jgi:hypothetical protein